MGPCSTSSWHAFEALSAKTGAGYISTEMGRGGDGETSASPPLPVSVETSADAPASMRKQPLTVKPSEREAGFRLQTRSVSLRDSLLAGGTTDGAIVRPVSVSPSAVARSADRSLAGNVTRRLTDRGRAGDAVGGARGGGAGAAGLDRRPGFARATPRSRTRSDDGNFSGRGRRRDVWRRATALRSRTVLSDAGFRAGRTVRSSARAARAGQTGSGPRARCVSLRVREAVRARFARLPPRLP